MQKIAPSSCFRPITRAICLVRQVRIRKNEEIVVNICTSYQPGRYRIQISQCARCRIGFFYVLNNLRQCNQILTRMTCKGPYYPLALGLHQITGEVDPAEVQTMDIQTPDFVHKRNDDWTIHAYCSRCWVTVADSAPASDVKAAESKHQCDPQILELAKKYREVSHLVSAA